MHLRARPPAEVAEALAAHQLRGAAWRAPRAAWLASLFARQQGPEVRALLGRAAAVDPAAVAMARAPCAMP